MSRGTNGRSAQVCATIHDSSGCSRAVVTRCAFPTIVLPPAASSAAPRPAAVRHRLIHRRRTRHIASGMQPSRGRHLLHGDRSPHRE